MKGTPHFTNARNTFHAVLMASLLKIDKEGVPSNADKHNRLSVDIARGIAEKLGSQKSGERLAGQTAGNQFEEICQSFIQNTFPALAHLRPGKWTIRRPGGGRNRLEIAEYDQYSHLIDLASLAKKNPQLSAALGSDYTITPDIIISREPETDSRINKPSLLVDKTSANLASLRKISGGKNILHASISCKWTIRSDRAQNARSEGLNLVRNRKGRLPHIVVVTGEPTPSRIASIALGTGDIDCVYHFALYELKETIEDAGLEDALDLLNTMIEGKRLKDISDLPLDLAV